jgi:hypothetical protein
VSNQQLFSNLIAHSQTDFFELKDPIYATCNKKYQGMFEQKEYAIGGSVDIKIPGSPEVQTGLVVTATDIQDLTVSYTITEDDILSVTRNLNSDEALFNIISSDKALTDQQQKAVVDNYGFPAYQALAAKVAERSATEMLTSAYLTPIDGIEKLKPLNNYDAVASIETMAEDLHFGNERYLMMNTRDSQLVSSSLQNMFNQSINEKITKTARVGGAEKGRLANFDVWRSTSLRRHTAGVSAGLAGITVTSVATGGASIVLAGVASSTAVLVKAGDLISIPSVYLCDDISHSEIPWRLVVKAAEDAVGDGAGNVSVTLSFPLMASGEHQNVMALPAPGAAVDIYPSYDQNYAYMPAGMSVVALKMPPIYGAINSDTRNKTAKLSPGFPVHVTMQGASLALSNNYRIYTLVKTKAFAPYMLTIPSAAL